MSSEPVAPLNNNEGLDETTLVSHPIPVERQLPIDSVVTEPIERQDGNPKLRETAETVGAAMGKAVNRVRDLPRRVSEVRERLTVIRGRTREDASSTAGELKENVRQKAYQARTRAQFYAREYPLEFLAGVAGVTFVLGFMLRIWRSSRRA